MKAKITTVGIVKNGMAIGWTFDFEGKGRGMEYVGGKLKYIAGYTIEELAEIASAK